MARHTHDELLAMAERLQRRYAIALTHFEPAEQIGYLCAAAWWRTGWPGYLTFSETAAIMRELPPIVRQPEEGK